MKRATVTIPDDLERAVEAYMRNLEVPPALTAVIQTALREYLSARGYLASEGEALVPSSSGKPRGVPLEKAPVIEGKDTVARAVIEDRR